MITKEFIEQHGLSPSEYLDTVDDQYKARWDRKLDQVELDDNQMDFLNSDDYMPINIVVIVADWCSDSQNAVPVLMKMAESSNYIDLFLLDRDTHKDVLQEYKINGGMRIPFVLFTNEKFEEINRWVERSILAYELLLEGKLEAINGSSNEYSPIVKNKYKNHSKELFEMNQKELFEVLKKAVIIRTSSASLSELKPKVIA